MVHTCTKEEVAHLAALALFLAESLLPGSAIAREASCLIRQDSVVTYAGRCQYSQGPSGSFRIRHADQRTILPSITDIAVTVVAPGIAEVRGLTTTGINSRWGPARRSRTDPACWTGADFEICAN